MTIHFSRNGRIPALEFIPAVSNRAMISTTQLVLLLAGSSLTYILLPVAQILYRNITSSLGYVDGPKNPSMMYGNFKQMADDISLTSKWRQEFGSIFQFKGLFGITELHLGDVKAISHIISRSDKYERTPLTRGSLTTLLGSSILSAEGPDHRRHRRALNPAFGVAQIRATTELFVEKAVQLREIWAREITVSPNGAPQIEVQSWLRRLTLDIIGKAGFNYDFSALESSGKPNELNDAFTQVLHSPRASRYVAFRAAGAVVPWLKHLPGPGRGVVNNARTTMLSIAEGIVSRRKDELKSSAL
ncbi:cytochrome P450 [Favolaschia claudopus]|uniref:Cytochrome P450 n=1 Tax=Favolaschia claudopus TaxID=2862362 RepID=A0AAV9ZVD9_9AGAR